jgi:hypothetical protein
METLGHSQESFTLDTYSHVLPSLEEEAASSIDAAIGCQIGCQTVEADQASDEMWRNL